MKSAKLQEFSPTSGSMQLREFTFVSPQLDAGQVFKAIESAIPITEIEQVVTASARDSRRQRKLPAHLVACLVIAMSLWSKAAMRFGAEESGGRIE